MDIFNSLTSGAKFNSKKNKETINLFKGKVESKNDIIDIFSSSSDKKTNSNNTQSNKKKQASKEQDEGDDNMFETEDEVNAFRNRLAIKVKGENIIDPVSSFSSMNINKEMKSIILKNIEASDWKEPTPIQMQAIPCLLDGRDVLASAPTGSGKTAAYSIPLLSNLIQSDNVGVRALVLSPTKELSDQIHREMMRLCEGKRFKICNLKKTLITQAIHNHKGTSLFQKYDILVATPMRLITLLRASAIDLSHVQYIVLDEADRLLELNSGHSNDDDDDEEEDNSSNKKKPMKKGNHSQEKTTKTPVESNDEEQQQKTIQHRVRSAFLTQIDEILSCCTQGINIQRALFSATINSFIKELSDNFLNDPIDISIGKQNTGASTIHQKLIFVGREDGKLLAIRQLVQSGLKPPVLCFVQSIERAKDLFQELIYDGINVDIMHANKSPSQREETIRRFRNGEIWVLICTDLMARGIDFKGIQMVINYDLPLTPVNYIHRIGRTGRGGNKGEAITFFTESDLPYLRPVANVVKLSGCEVPDWMLAIKPLSTKEKRKLKVSAPKRRNIAASRLPWVEHSAEESEETNKSMKKRKAKSQDNEEEDYENDHENNQEEHWDQELTSYEENNQELHFGDIYDAEDNDQVYFHEQEPQPTEEQTETKSKKKTKGSKKEGKMSKKSSWEETENNEEQEIVFGDMLDAEDNDQIYFHDNKTNPKKKKHTKKQAASVVDGQKRPRTLSEEDFGEGDIEQPLHYLGDNFDAEDYDQSFYHEDEQEYQLPPSQSASSLSPSMGQTDKKKKKRKKN